ncbi:MAG: glycosyltransferase, partial [Candidatus Dormibacteraeota bacterium]|nr:glycosyltransferase [Candidatus Dormibacteraeota bacterium]
PGAPLGILRTELMRPRILFLFSDTGGGHRASASAVARALELEYPAHFDVQLVDPFVQGGGPLLGWIVYRYNFMLKHLPRTYGFIFHATNNRAIMRLAIRVFGRQVRPGLRRHLQELKPDGIVSFHPLTNHVTVEVMDEIGIKVPFITVVTDMVDLHRFWLTGRADLVVVPSTEARRYCIKRGLDPRKVHVEGLPVNPNFTGPASREERREMRHKLGFEPDQPTLLMAAGGEGAGRLGAFARALDNAGLGLQLVVVCGRNAKEREKLSRRTWKGKVHVLGYVDNMPELMRAADTMVTKAGPGTITEALVSGLPIFLTGFVPGQEEGNVRFVEEEGVGFFTPSPRKLVKAVRARMINDTQGFDRMRGRAEKVSSKDSSQEIAELVAATVDPNLPHEELD